MKKTVSIFKEKPVSIFKVKQWKRNGKVLPVSWLSLPTDYNSKTDRLVESDIWGWHNHSSGTFHSDANRPYEKDKYPVTDSENRKIQLAEALIKLGYKIADACS